MEGLERLKDLKMTPEEVDKLGKAFKDEKFREMLRDYAEEISNPENKRRYEEEITFMEQQRGISIDFIHPKPFRVLRTSVNGNQKCFINICSNEKVGKPECKCGVSEDGRRGQNWSLPHSMHPARQDTDSKGNQITIYDVIFHPDTVHLASKNQRFMDMLDSTAIQGIQKAFQVTLDQNNVRQLKTKYKGTPQPCVIRKPIPGYKAEEPSVGPDISFPLPPTPSLQTKPPEAPAPRNSSDEEPKSFQLLPQQSKEPTRPNYTVKYRSFIDLQDFRYSRDSAQSPRPKEIVITIDIPLLKSVTDTSLEVTKRSLLLNSEKPAYRLELPLAYPVDEEKGEAKFNKLRGQLTVTLPVLPSDEVFDFALGSITSVDDGQGGGVDEGEVKENEEEQGKEQGMGNVEGNAEQSGVEGEEVKQEGVDEQDMKQQTKGGGEEEEQITGDQGGVEGEEISAAGVEEKLITKKREGEESGDIGSSVEETQWKKQNTKDENVKEGRGKEEKAKEQKQENTDDEKSTGEHSREEEGVDLTSDIQKETEKTKENLQEIVPVEADFVLQSRSNSSEELSATSTTSAHHIVGDISNGTEVSGTDQPNESGFPCSGEQSHIDNLDEDDLDMEQSFQTSGQIKKPSSALLREIDEDGKEKVISDHSTSAGFNLHNSLMYELD